MRELQNFGVTERTKYFLMARGYAFMQCEPDLHGLQICEEVELMCGIVGYIGNQQATPFLINGLKKLEYRGYDSAGICEINNSLTVQKTKGRIADLEAILSNVSIEGKIGIGHTRWATHGEPSDENAHPHNDCSGRIAVVHNGIIENYQQIKSELVQEGHRFMSETDTEVISHLIEKYFETDLLEAVRAAVECLQGSYAIAVVSVATPDEIIVVRQDSPLVIGLGDGENYVASDIPAILEYTDSVYILEDGELARITADRVSIFSKAGQEVEKDIFTVEWDSIQAEKEGYADFMLKEIHEQPKAVRDTITGRIGANGTLNVDNDLQPELVKDITKVEFIACGTAFHASLFGRALLEQYTNLYVDAELASEYRYKKVKADHNTLVIVISQSGETADTLGAMRIAKAKGARVLAITNVVGSTLSREADAVMYTHAGPEIAVASTKAYTTQLVCLCLITAYIQQHITGCFDTELIVELQTIPEKIETVLTKYEGMIQSYARNLVNATDTFFLGRGLDFASAMEGQLKLKEISYIHGEALAAGELKHGTLALIVPEVPVLALVTQPQLIDKTMSNLREVQARGGEILLLAMDENRDFTDVADQVLLIPKTHPLLAPILTVVPMQALAYYAAKVRGCDVDKPRNLAKSVTVE